MKSPLAIIIRREYFERVMRKSFIISTLLTPILMIGLMLTPALVALFSGPEDKVVAVIDQTPQKIGKQLESDGDLKFRLADSELQAAMDNEDFDAVLLLGSDIVSHPDNVKLYSHEAASMQTESAIRNQLENIIENERLKSYDIENLAQIMKEVKVDVNLETFRISEGDASETSSLVSYLVGMFTSLMLYMFIMIYGQMVMTSIIEEKNNRVLEIVVSSVNPNALMMGKIIGIGLVAITQILIWGLLLTACSYWLMPLVAGAAEGLELGVLGSPWYIAELFGYIMLFLVGGYLFYSSIYAAHHPGHGYRHGRGAGSVVVARRVDLHHTLHIARGDDGAYPLRHPRLGNHRVGGGALRVVLRAGVAVGQNLPRRHLHVRQKTEHRRTHPLGPL